MAYLNVFDTTDEDGDNFANTEQTDSPATMEKNVTSAPVSGISTELTRREGCTCYLYHLGETRCTKHPVYGQPAHA